MTQPAPAGESELHLVPLRRIRSDARRTPLDLPELWRYRDLWLTLALRYGKLRYRQTALGIPWVVLLPRIATGGFTLVLAVLRLPPTERHPHILLLFCIV